ncbi:MAG TPA: YibE/F family protein [Patescibacteria group bacterium]|nr:YibE/F family protein [Patescibacteria group bacterium]
MVIKKLLAFFFFILIFFCLPIDYIWSQETQEMETSLFQEELLEGKVISLLDEKSMIRDGEKLLYQELEVRISKGSLAGEKIKIEVGDIPIVGQPKYQVGDEVMISYSKDFEGKNIFIITDFIRRKPLVWLFLIFVVLALIVGQWRGGMSLLGLVISFAVIFLFILPQIYKGEDPIIIAIVGSLIIIPATFLLSHGLNRKTLVAMAGTLIALLIVGLLSKFFIELTKLTGYASEEAAFLHLARRGQINIKGILLAGIIIGTLGILDDITISQAAIIQQLKKANPKMKTKELFLRAMDVGQDHIASMINTLVLVYTGAALPLMLLFIDNPRPFSEIINYQMIAEEIVRTLVGSVGLILAVPITTILASKIAFRDRKQH